MDLGTRRYETFAELYEYCIRVASAVGLICLNIFGARDPGARQYAIDLGVALQLTNILRDIPGDMAQGRLYVPLDDLRTYGCTEADLLAESGRRRTGRALGSGAGAAPAPGGAGARLLPTGGAGAAAPAIGAAWWRPRSWARSIARCSAGSSGAATTCSRAWSGFRGPGARSSPRPPGPGPSLLP